ncbi:MAG TPA: hypothetical protein VN673_01055 [Clostridia bacterium]|nr:hypothetical protein [Clostridia bacterium]
MILLISVCCLIAGAAGICVVTSGPESILFAPLFAIFGWFYLVPIYMLVALMWLVYRRRAARLPWPLLFVVGGAAVGGGLIALLGLGATDLAMHDGMVLGGILAGGVSNLMIALLKPLCAELGAAPNGGPAVSLADSGAPEGPPSVS